MPHLRRHRTARAGDATSGRPIGATIVHVRPIQEVHFVREGKQGGRGPIGWDGAGMGILNRQGIHAADESTHADVSGADARCLLARGAGVHAAFSGPGSGTRAGRVRVWSVVPDPRPAEKLKVIAAVLSCHLIDDSLGPYPLNAADWRAAWDHARRKHPDLFRISPARTPVIEKA